MSRNVHQSTFDSETWSRDVSSSNFSRLEKSSRRLDDPLVGSCANSWRHSQKWPNWLFLSCLDRMLLNARNIEDMSPTLSPTFFWILLLLQISGQRYGYSLLTAWQCKMSDQGTHSRFSTFVWPDSSAFLIPDVAAASQTLQDSSSWVCRFLFVGLFAC